MSNGILMFAYNSRQIDYARLALLSGKLAKKHLQVPASLVTDESTLEWCKESNILTDLENIFENLIIENVKDFSNFRILHDGESKEKVPFKNFSRSKAWYLTPYDRTLMIDNDYFVFSDVLGHYWDSQEDFLISSSINDIVSNDRLGHGDKYISETGTRLFWATTLMFTKNEYTKTIFDFVEHIKDNYKRYAEIYRFDHRIYRNDIAFSIALHLTNGFNADHLTFLPPVLTALDKDILIDVKDGMLHFLTTKSPQDDYLATSIGSLDLHIMNKQSIVRNFDKLMEMI